MLTVNQDHRSFTCLKNVRMVTVVISKGVILKVQIGSD